MRDFSADDDDDLDSSEYFFFEISEVSTEPGILLFSEDEPNENLRLSVIGDNTMEDVERKESVLSKTDVVSASFSTVSLVSSWTKLFRSLVRGFCTDWDTELPPDEQYTWH